MNKLGLIKNVESSVSNSSLDKHFVDLANFECSQTPSLVSSLKTKFPVKFAKNYESQTENPSVVVALPRIYESKRESAIFRHCEANRRFAEAIQKIAQTESRPIRGAKNRIQGRSSASADFLLESELRGTPPKSEKAATFGEHNLNIWGERRRKVQPFLRKEKGEIDDKGFAESNLDFANYAKVAGYTL